MKIFMKKVIGSLLLMSSVLGTAVAGDEIHIKVAYENNPGEPTDLMIRHWAENLKKKSNGNVILDLYPSSQLGSKGDVMEQAMMGMNVITITDTGFLSDYDPDLGILYGPYLTDNPKKLFELYDSDWFKQKEAALKEKGIHIVIKNHMYGMRHLLTKKPVNKPEDLKGMKIRVPNNVIQIKSFEAMGATPTPMPLGDVYPALTQGVIDGAENPLSVLYGQKLHEQAKYLSKIGYITSTVLWVGGEAFFSKLPPETLKIIHETGYEACLYSQEQAQKIDEEITEKMRAAGVTIITPDIATFKEKTKAVYKEFASKWSPNLYDTIQQQLK